MGDLKSSVVRADIGFLFLCSLSNVIHVESGDSFYTKNTTGLSWLVSLDGVMFLVEVEPSYVF